MEEKKSENVERKKVKQQGTEQKQKMIFLSDFCCFFNSEERRD